MVIKTSLHIISAMIEDKCRNIMNVNMWYNLPDSLFWPIVDAMDINNEEFVVNTYKKIERHYLDILLHTPVLISIVESLQSSLMVEFIKSICEKEQDSDGFLLFDVESCLFVNYEDDAVEKAELFNKIYNELKEMVNLSRKHIHDEKMVFDDLKKITKFIEINTNIFLM